MINQEIVNAVCAHANKEGSGYHNWYCGIASNLNERLFEQHNVPKGEGKAWWIKKDAGSEQNARDTESYLLSLGFDGGDGGGDYTTRHLYAYKKIPSVTRQ